MARIAGGFFGGFPLLGGITFLNGGRGKTCLSTMYYVEKVLGFMIFIGLTFLVKVLRNKGYLAIHLAFIPT